MSTMNLSATTLRPSRSSPWRALWTLIVEWRQRVRSRHELMSLGEAELRDIGLSRGEAEHESSKPFWMT